MKKTLIILLLCILLKNLSLAVDVANDQKALINYYKLLYPDVIFEDYSNGVYAIDEDLREQFEEILDSIVPYEDEVARGGEEFIKFSLGECSALKDPVKARIKHPYYNETERKVITLENTIKKCYQQQTGKKLSSNKGKIARISAWISDQAEGQKINVIVESSGAKEAYQKGKQFFYAKRGQLNMSCADCHVYNVGRKIRAEILSPAIGHTTHIPMYRAQWGAIGTLHNRYGGCLKSIRAHPLKAGSEAFNNLEFFHQAMSNNLEVTVDRYRR